MKDTDRHFPEILEAVMAAKPCTVEIVTEMHSSTFGATTPEQGINLYVFY